MSATARSTLSAWKRPGSGSVTYHGDSYNGAMQMKMQDREMSAKMTGKYLGACDGTEVNK